jgi:hypothetical protein
VAEICVAAAQRHSGTAGPRRASTER